MQGAWIQSLLRELGPQMLYGAASKKKKKKKNEGNKTQKQRDWEHILLGIRDFSLLFPNLSAILSKQWQKLSCVGTSGVQLFDHNPPDFFVEVLPPWTVPPSLA